MQMKDKCFEPMLKYKYLTIASGATPIGSTGRAPDENSGREKKKRSKERGDDVLIVIIYSRSCT